MPELEWQASVREAIRAIPNAQEHDADLESGGIAFQVDALEGIAVIHETPRKRLKLCVFEHNDRMDAWVEIFERDLLELSQLSDQVNDWKNFREASRSFPNIQHATKSHLRWLKKVAAHKASLHASVNAATEYHRNGQFVEAFQAVNIDVDSEFFDAQSETNIRDLSPGLIA